MSKKLINLDIPNDWNFIFLSKIAKIKMGQSPPSSTYNNNELGLPFYQGNIDFGFVHPTAKTWCTEPKRKAKPDDILVSVRAPVGEMNISEELCCIGRGLAAIEVRPLHEAKYVYYSLNNFKRVFKRLEQGSTFTAINKSDLVNFPLLIPDKKEEQQKIASILSNVDEILLKTQQLIDQLKLLKKGLMQQLFSQGIGHTEFKETKWGKIPKEWEIMKLIDLITIRSGKRLPKGHKFSEEKTPYPYIRVVDFHNGSANIDQLEYLTPKDYEVIKKYFITKDDVYISIAGTIGLVGTIPIELDGANLTENAASLVIKETKILSKNYLSYYLSSDFGQIEIRKRKTKTSIPKLALKRIYNLPIFLPSIIEQEQIIKVLKNIDEIISLEINYKKNMKKTKKGLMQQLLTGKKRVLFNNQLV